MFRTLFAAAVVLAAAGCATPVASGPATSPAQAQVSGADGSATGLIGRKPKKGKKGEDWICYYEKPVGSNIPEQICRPKERAEEDRNRTQDMLRLMPVPSDKKG